MNLSSQLPRKQQQGFTLIELLFVVAIIGMLAAVALPAYSLYQNKARFSEAILAIGGHRSAISKAASIGRAGAIADFDAGTLEIPATTVATATDHGIDVVDGAITITWRSDGSSLAGEPYTLAAQGFVPPVQWVASGYC